MQNVKNAFGYCCITSASHPYTPVTADDIRRIANYFRIPIERFIKEYTRPRPPRMVYTEVPHAIRHLGFNDVPGPCIFLRQGMCGIHHIKPEICRNYKPGRYPGISCQQWSKLKALGKY